MRVQKFVLDANVWVSYFISKQEGILLNILADEDVTLFSCKELIAEITRVLAYPRLSKYKVNIQKSIRFVNNFTLSHTLVYPIKSYIPQDPDDNYVIALALQTGSGFVTSGDNDILEEKFNLEHKFSKLKIITKVEFEGMFG